MSALPGTEGAATTCNQSQEPAAPPSLGKHQQSSRVLLGPHRTRLQQPRAPRSPAQTAGRSLAEDPSLCSGTLMHDTGFLQVQHTVEDYFRFFSSKRGFLEAELEAVSVNWGDGNGREESGAVVMGRAGALLASSADSAAFLVCNSCKLTPLQLFIRVCSSSETLLLKQAFICLYFFF